MFKAINTPSVVRQQRELLMNDNSKWKELSPRERERVQAHVIGGKDEWHTLPHLDKPGAPARYFRQIAPDAFQIKCLKAGRVVHVFDVHPNPPATSADAQP